MSTLVFVEEQADDRLAELDLTPEILQRVIRRADAEAHLCTPFDPPLLEGLTRWGRAEGPRYQMELSLPGGFADGTITHWDERIILPPFPRHDDPVPDVVSPADIVVEVAHRS